MVIVSTKVGDFTLKDDDKNATEQLLLNGRLEIAEPPPKKKQRLDGDCEGDTYSSSESSEDPSSSEFEMEQSTADISKKVQQFPARRQEISITGKHNQIFERCKIKVFQGAEKENRSRETLHEFSSSSCKRSRSPSPQTRLPRKRRRPTDASALEKDSIADLCNNLDFKSEKVKNETSELFELLRVCKNRPMEKEDESKQLKKENELLKGQNTRLRNASRPFEILKGKLTTMKKENLKLQKENESVNRQNSQLRNAVRLSENLRYRFIMTEGENLKLKWDNESLKYDNNELKNASITSEIVNEELIMTKDENLKLQRENESLNRQNSELRYTIRSSEILNDTVIMTEEENQKLQRENELLKCQNRKLRKCKQDF